MTSKTQAYSYAFYVYLPTLASGYKCAFGKSIRNKGRHLIGNEKLKTEKLRKNFFIASVTDDKLVEEL